MRLLLPARPGSGSRRQGDLATRDFSSDLYQFAADWDRPFLENGWNVASLPNHCNNRDEALGEWLVHDVVLSNRVNQQAGSSAEFLPPTQCALVLCNELRPFVQIIEISARQFLTPSRTRPRSCFTQV